MLEKLLTGILPLFSALIIVSLVLAVYKMIFWGIDKISPKKKGSMFVTLAIMFSIFLIGASPVMAAPEAVSVSCEQIGLDGLTFVVSVKGLTASTSYEIAWYDTSYHEVYNFTAEASGEFMGWVQISSPAAKVCQVGVSTDGSTMSTYKNVVIEDIDVLVPITPLTEIFVALLLIAFVVGILLSVKRAF